MSQPIEEKRYPAKHSAVFAGSTLVTMGVVDLLAHLGPTGLVVGGIASYVAWKHGPELYEQAKGIFPSHAHPEMEQPDQRESYPRTVGRSFFDRALGRYPEQEQEATEFEGEAEGDVFALEYHQQALPCERLKMKAIIAHIPENSYRVYLGRSVLLKDYPARSVSILKQHLKLIGASQKGKSSMAACVLEQIIRTHDLDHALIAILDLEDRTGKLFEDDPHIVTFCMSGENVKMHARSKEQVLEYLGYIVQLMDYRYTLSTTAVAEMPLLIVYLEEFLALKDYYKRRVSGAKNKEQAQADYDALIYNISELARRGLKARIQLLLCAQVDYRDEDLYEALANITAGMSFCVKPTAAQAAGFTDVEMLKRNHKENIVGQAVAEFSGCKDLVLAPDYDLEQKIMALENVHRIHHSPEDQHFERGERENGWVNGNAVNPVNAPMKPVNRAENGGEYSPRSENIHMPSPPYSPAEEMQVILAYAELQKSGKTPTRTGIRDYLAWDNKQYQRVIKPVCDKHTIAPTGV